VKDNRNIKTKKGMFRDVIILDVTVIIAIILLLLFPDKQKTVISKSWEIFIEMLGILPAVMVLMGLFTVLIPKEMVVKYLGKTSGLKGIILAIFLGALPTGPLYVAFPIAVALIEKGARISNVIIFLSAWACIKIPQEMMEFRFLGLKFMALRLFLTIVFVIIMGTLIEQIIEWSDKVMYKYSKVTIVFNIAI